MNSGIYKITCKANDNFYIGRSVNYSKRMNDHLRDLRDNKHKNQRLQNNYDKYGENSFVFELIIPLPRVESIHIEEEQKLINLVIEDSKCMNINKTAGGGCVVPMTEERKRKIGQANMGKTYERTPEHRQKLSSALMGHELSEETKKKISESHKGKKLSEDHREKIRLATAGKNNPRYGMTGAKNSNSKPILQIDLLTGEVIREFASCTDAGRILGMDSSGLSKVCRGKLKKAYGYIWRFKEGVTTIESDIIVS